MRLMLVMLGLGLASCGNPDAAKQNEGALAATPAAFTFDGADATDAAARIAHGKRLSQVLGCTGCHKANLEGQWFNDDMPELGKLYASNLTVVLPTMTDAQLEALLRTGKHPTRGDMWIMPSEVFQRLSDPDMRALIAHLRTIKPSGEATPPPALSEMAKKAVASGQFKPVAAYVAEFKAKPPPKLGEQHAWGRYLTGATCAECHGGDLTGITDFTPGLDTPDLNVAGAYSDAEMVTLLTTGEGKVKKDLGLMSLVGKSHFSHLTPRERGAIIAYLKARAERPQ